VIRGIPIKWKIILLTFGIVLYSLLIGEITYIGNIIRQNEQELSQSLLVTARTVAQMPAITEQLSDSKQKGSMNNLVERIRAINNVDYIVVMDMNRKIYTDPLDEKIGTFSKSADEAPAFVEHTYTSKAKGDLGTALRAFVPVMDETNNTQVGVVLVGKVLPSLWDVLLSMHNQIFITLSLSLLFGVLGSWQLAKHIKKQMLELEPYEISKLLLERTATFHAMHEGIISIDNDDRITVFNDKAMHLLKIGTDVIGRPIRDVVPDERLAEILESNQTVYNQELQVGTDVILYDRVPIRLNEQIAGAVMIFQDRTEVAKLAEELTGVRAFVDALRVQNHEFMNKLHTIAGLIQLDNKEKVLKHILEISEEREELTRFLSSRILDDHLAGLLLAKINRGKELGVDVKIDRNSKMNRFPEILDHHDLVALIGNLIENGFDAVRFKEEKEIFVSIDQDSDTLSILVEDNGCGISEDVQGRIFEKGFTTKPGVARGYGMYLVKSIVDKGQGHIAVDSQDGHGTSFVISFPMKTGVEGNK
jgi:two-component system, CitB family, sensor histidine kinase DctS